MSVRLSIRILGAVLYVISFFCTAVYSGNTEMLGYMCAAMTLIGQPFPFLIPFGAVNPLLLLYACSLPFTRARRFRRMVAVAVLVLVPAATAFIVAFGLRFGVGHLLWAAGIGLIVCPEFVEEPRAQPST